MPEKIPLFSSEQLKAICKVLADTNDGLKGGEIAHILQDCRIQDVSPEMTKWQRLYNAFVEIQNEKQMGNYIVMFINRAMNPVNYTNASNDFLRRQEQYE